MKQWYKSEIQKHGYGVAVEPVHRVVLGVYISRHRNMLATEHFLHSLIEKYGSHMVYSDIDSWYPKACTSLRLEHRFHSPYEKSIIERAIEYVKDRTEQFDDYYPCMKSDCTLSHVHNWIQLFVFMHNGIRRSHLKFSLLMYLVGGDTSH